MHPSEWLAASNHFRNENYRLCCDSHPHVGQVLAAMLLNLQKEWGNPPIFDYMQRWMNGDRSAEAAIRATILGTQLERDEFIQNYPSHRPRDSFINELWDQYSETTNSTNEDGDFFCNSD